jgi:ribulose-phosphate 3-epimerase
MNARICPTVTATSADEYRQQMERLLPFAVRLHIDVADGLFTPVKLTPLDQVWWPGGVRADIHVMYKNPFGHLPILLSLRPQMIIVHAEGEGDFAGFARAAHENGVEVGVALKPETSPELIRPALGMIDHVLIFSGHLGHFGGQADLSLLEKVKTLKEWKPQLEIGWDGGINNQNAAALAKGGVEVLNTGGFIHHAQDPMRAYETLQALANGEEPPAKPISINDGPGAATAKQAVNPAGDSGLPRLQRPVARPRLVQ